METVTGKIIQEGFAVGPLRVWRRREAPPPDAAAVLPPAQERARFEAARAQAGAQLEALCRRVRAELGEDGAAIFEIHRMMLEDEDYLDAIHAAIDGGCAAAAAVLTAGGQFAAVFAAMDDAYMQARAADVEDVSRRVAAILDGRGGEAPFSADGPFLLAAEDLAPSELAQLDRSRLLGLVTRWDSVTSHTAILARTMGVPALTGVAIRGDWDGRRSILDAAAGRLTIDPGPALLSAAEQTLRDRQTEAAQLLLLRGKPNVTLDGREIEVCANIGGPGDLPLVLQNDAQGVGLFRSEFLFLEAERLPTEEEQFAAYRQVVEAMAGKRTVIRTLDLGADKQAPCLPLEKEENPALGLRAIRLCLTRRDLFKTQLRAILRAAAFGRTAILLPMIASLWEVREAKVILAECRAELGSRGERFGEAELGVMIETPAAVMIAEELAREVDFFSLGTNDLTQYALAIDRRNPALEPFCDTRHPAVLRMIRYAVEAGRRHGCRVGVCGQLAADPALTEDFLRMGMDELSVPPSAILPLRRSIRSLDLGGERKRGEGPRRF